jgi:hypothetical protein
LPGRHVADGIAWTTQSSSITIPSGKTLWGNRTVWIEGATWYMLQEAGPTPWEIYLYTSSDGLTWTIANGGAPLTTLQVHAGGAYGGPAFSSNNDVASQRPRSARPTTSGTTRPGSGAHVPTNIYHATSTDRITWTQTSPAPVLTHTGSGLEVDQVADPTLVVSGTTAYLFYDGVINAHFCHISARHGCSQRLITDRMRKRIESSFGKTLERGPPRALRRPGHDAQPRSAWKSRSCRSFDAGRSVLRWMERLDIERRFPGARAEAVA